MKAAHRLALLHGALLAVGCAHPRPAVPPRSAPPTPFAGLQRGMQVVMGTRLFVALEPPAGADGAALLAEVFSIARAHDGLLSNYQPDSALSRLNRRDGGPLRAPAELLRFLRRGQRYCAATAGAFDLTVGALTSPQARLTRSERLALARRTVGCDKLRIDGRDASLPPGTRIDPGGLGKGYALDAMVARLRARGVRRAFIDFGGSSFYGLGAPRGQAGWPVLLDRAAFRRDGTARGRAMLRDTGLSSSATLADGRRPHIIDPRSGRLVRVPRLAVVESPSASDAEALSTALIVDPELLPRLARTFPRARLRLFRADRTPVRPR